MSFLLLKLKKLDDWKVRAENDFTLGIVETNTLTSDTWILEKNHA